MPPNPWYLQAYVVKLGTNTTESVAVGRREFHEAIARRLGLTPLVVDRPAEMTTFLPADQIRDQPRLLGELLNLSDDDERRVAIIDCSLNHYEVLSDSILLSVAMCATAFAKTKNHLCVIMLPKLPHHYHNSFWEPFATMDISGGTVLVYNNEGKVESKGRPRTKVDLGSFYEQQQQQLTGTIAEEFQDKIIRRMGHFDVNDRYCSRYFFDGTRAVRELSYLLVDQVTELVSRRTMARTELIVPEQVDLWMGDAVTVACERLKMRQMKWPSAPDRVPAPNPHTKYLIVTDFVNTGTTYRRIVAEVRDAGYELHTFAISAFGAEDLHGNTRGLPQVSPIKPVTVDRVLRTDCPQCQLGLPFTEKYRNDMVGLRSYDAWDMLSHVSWSPERYGPPPERMLHRALPDFEELFDKFGDYLAYKLEMVLRFVVPDIEVAVVCPDEPGVNAIVKRMQPWADNRIVAVHLPREVLNHHAGGGDVGTYNQRSEWVRQLRRLEERNAPVVILDEFNASNRTVRHMTEVLAAFHLQPRAYTPVFNFMPSEQIDGVRVVALYEMPNPRKMRSE
jgi:hypothetical protein